MSKAKKENPAVQMSNLLTRMFCMEKHMDRVAGAFAEVLKKWERMDLTILDNNGWVRTNFRSVDGLIERLVAECVAIRHQHAATKTELVKLVDRVERVERTDRIKPKKKKAAAKGKKK